MPARRRLATTKLSAAEERRLVTDYNIRFDGPVLPSQWPAQHSAIYQAVRTIETVKYEEYFSQTPPSPAGKTRQIRTLNRVHALIRAASDCRKASLHEGEWRRSTEELLLRHFDDELECSTCKNRLWLAEFRGMLGRPTRSMCVCNPNETLRGEGIEALSDTSKPFRKRLDMSVFDHSGRPEQIGARKPDAVIGLRRSDGDRIDKLVCEFQDLQCNKFDDDRGIAFPFLVLEAKSEVAGPGFQSVETQTAFPIRALINIQKSLAEHARMHRDPLLWFIAFSGEIWKVYGCSSQGAEIRITELWHGTILRHDCALQLYLIIDFIYDWAVEVYREDVFQCLAAAQSLASEDSHSLSTLQQADQLHDDRIDHLIDDSSATYASQPHGSCPSTDGTLPLDVISQPRQSSNDIEMADSILLQNDITEDSNTDNGPRHYSEDAVIRNADEVFFTFHHLILPEGEADIISILTSIRPNDSAATTAYNLLLLFNAENPIILNEETVFQMEEQWTGSSHPSSRGERGAIFAIISFSTYFRPTDWQLMRDISCISASIGAINALGSIALGGYNSVIDGSQVDISNLTGDVVRPLSAIFGQQSTAAAAKNLCLSLEKNPLGFDWVEARPEAKFIAEVWKGLDSNTPDIPLVSILFYSSVYKVVEGTMSVPGLRSISLVKLSSQTQRDGALILKRPISWSWYSQCPKYCLTVFDRSNIHNNAAMGHKLSQVLAHGGFYLNSGRRIEDDDRRAIESWIENLLADGPSDAA